MLEDVVSLGIPSDGLSMQNDIVAPYLLGSPRSTSRRAGCPASPMAPSSPSSRCRSRARDPTWRRRTTARYDGDEIVVDGSKTLITNGSRADLVVVLARTGEAEGSKELSLVFVEAGTPGFVHGKPFEKIDQHGQDTAELFFDRYRVA